MEAVIIVNLSRKRAIFLDKMVSLSAVGCEIIGRDTAGIGCSIALFNSNKKAQEEWVLILDKINKGVKIIKIRDIN